MEDFYDELKMYKDRHRLTNKDLGSHINMEGEAFRMAVVRKSLSELEKERLKNVFEGTNNSRQTESPPENQSGGLNDDIVMNYVFENMERLKSNPKFMMIIGAAENKAAQKAVDEFKELIGFLRKV